MRNKDVKDPAFWSKKSYVEVCLGLSDKQRNDWSRRPPVALARRGNVEMSHNMGQNQPGLCLYLVGKQMGDIFDRGDDDLPIQEWVYELAQEAGRAKGALYSVMGNHEVRARDEVRAREGGWSVRRTCGISSKEMLYLLFFSVLQIDLAIKVSKQAMRSRKPERAL